MTRRRRLGRFHDAALWTLGHAVRVWPFVLFGVVIWLS